MSHLFIMLLRLLAYYARGLPPIRRAQARPLFVRAVTQEETGRGPERGKGSRYPTGDPPLHLLARSAERKRGKEKERGGVLIRRGPADAVMTGLRLGERAFGDSREKGVVSLVREGCPCGRLGFFGLIPKDINR